MLVLGVIMLAIVGCCLLTVVVEGILLSAGLRVRVLASVGLLVLLAASAAGWTAARTLASALARAPQTLPAPAGAGLMAAAVLLALFVLVGAAAALARPRSA
jgi:hypothetical protein